MYVILYIDLTVSKHLRLDRANERLLLAMGYRVAHIAHWQWTRLK